MAQEQRPWGWIIVIYLFLGGLAAGLFLVGAVADFVFGVGEAFRPGLYLSPVLVGVGSLLLVFDLGRPERMWRVFVNPSAIMTVGAWVLLIFMAVGALYASCWLPFLPWSGNPLLRHSLAVVGGVLAVATAIYTGVLLGGVKAYPFWNSPALPVLFLVSSVSTGLAAHGLLLPLAGTHDVAGLESVLGRVDAGVLLLELIVLVIYAFMMYGTTFASSTIHQSVAASPVIRGKLAAPFWGGVIGVGIVLPLVLYLLGSGGPLVWLAEACVLVGGLLLRYVVVYAGARTKLPGEQRFLDMLPGPAAVIWHTDWW